MFQTFFVQPLYNGFIYLIGVMPGGDVGLAIIALTLLVRLAFYPIFTAQIRTTIGMQAIQGELNEINKKYKDKAEERARRTMQLMKDNKVNPFALFISLLIQLPIFFALYLAFFHATLPAVDLALLYSFVPAPSLINIYFLGFVDLTLSHNILLSIVVGALQYLVVHFSLGRTPVASNLPPERAAAQKMQQRMMLYLMPALIVGITYSLPAAVGVYFAAGSLISLAQEWVIRKQMFKKAAA